MLAKLYRRALGASLICAIGFSGQVHAGYTDVVFFGDSLSDTGNVLSLTRAVGAPLFPNFSGSPGRFSNGPVWSEYLAEGIGLADSARPTQRILTAAGVVSLAQPGEVVGSNYAFGGARTGLGGSAGATTGLLGQLVAWNGSTFVNSLTRAADRDALYVVFAGANDLRDVRSANFGTTPADSAARAAAAADVAQGISTAVALLAQAGARHFLLSSLPDLGKAPEALALDQAPGGAGKQAASTEVTLGFNAALAAQAAGVDALFNTNFGIDLDIKLMDVYGLFEAIINDARTTGGATYGISNVDAPCINPVAPGVYFVPGSTAGSNCSVSAFSDDLHPSAAAHRQIGRLALATVPEPASLPLALGGLLLLTLTRASASRLAFRRKPAAERD
ncbi:MAG TPA: SGNH/GDSL hydrolase family protein [Accumulibacter sp.]|uniref:SGNH/GDSL hydrolase family protein n=2 Tax=Accumulibacter sp. TaxID=2053492 RepID=UPI00287A9AD7|nr:SGNH/GDSL hydrolase family protein [Accumulibacter sp.]MDS4053904.1 SGNH/GDSL hydrolase family protein [Accumulibacter sp.]HMW65246.1 SGNH/GDSL hydrolase family protein [Accumulibacter sp.]HNC27275.1 SGNH/GDSL hydrolase family protein [Accumulibacter sp.]HNJ52013.1 SGNH/GDSL hydrolase family protein [Accumulibacter sp.]HNK04556.1 SGNH/GDSL hydrolase family protein [Accumulibacter sp.]